MGAFENYDSSDFQYITWKRLVRRLLKQIIHVPYKDPKALSNHFATHVIPITKPRMKPSQMYKKALASSSQ